MTTQRPENAAPNGIDDDEPFGSGSSMGLAAFAAVAGGEHARLGVEADDTRRFRLAIERWARNRGIWGPEGGVVATAEDGTVVTATLAEMTVNVAVVRATARAPAATTFSVETTSRSWTDRLRARFASKPATTGDDHFDAWFTVRAADAETMRALVDDHFRAALLELRGWCRVTYTEGRIELRLDVEHLAGAHLLHAIEAALALARARAHTTAYR
jgi:hypothetical protein